MSAAEALLRSAPATQLTVCRYGLWNGALLLGSGACVAIATAWLVASEGHDSKWDRWAVMTSSLVALMALLSEARRSAVGLRWDGESWYVRHGFRQIEDPNAFSARVMLDLGNWMLLKFSAMSRTERPSRLWVPVQRRGIEPHWHALRCAVYSPRLDSAILPHLDGLTRID